MFRILHLSDVHIGKTYKDPESIACKIASDIDYNGLSPINSIIVTGDIFDGQAGKDGSLVDIAVKFFKTLLTEINSNQERYPINKHDIIFIPGNHDLVRTEDLDERWSKYRSFLVKFYGSIPDFYDTKNYSLLKEYKEHKIAIVGFNSCEIEKRKLFDEKYIHKFEKYISDDTLKRSGIDKAKVIEALKAEVANEYDDYGYIPLSQITPIERRVRKLDDFTIIALFHHHFYLFPEVAKQFGDSSLIRNYAEVIQHLRYMNVSVVLHGHKHFALERPFIMDDYYESSENIIDVFAGGSVGTNRKEDHTFGILDLYEKKDDIKLEHHKFVYNGENLEPITKKRVPPQKLSVRTVKLLEILKTLNPEKHEKYTETAEKSFKSYDKCSKIMSWVSEAITGFTEVYKYLDKDYNNILFLLYAINYRTICYMKIVGKEDSYFDSASETWRAFYEANLKLSDFTVSPDEYYDLFELKKLKQIASYCDQLLSKTENKKSQIYLAFTMLGIFFTDLYLVLTTYADDFKESIKYKVNIKIEENKFHQNVPAPRIVVRSDADRRSAYIELLCNEATAHKMAVLFIKEFDLLINKFEDYFKLIGLKIYYLLPRIDKDKMKNTLDNYNFEAYIPTLIPLLTGDNIYSSKVVFARELIQNSIDAISVREATKEKDFSKTIFIEIKIDENGKRYFKITDNGTGMDRFKIERYFTSIGRSFYSGEEYKDLNIDYKPISNFGIGFLSSFMVCQEIDVRTKYYDGESEGLKLHIPNYDGCFFIELDKDANVGTELKLYLDNSVTDRNIVDYISKVMQDIKYPIKISYLNEKGKEVHHTIPAHSIRTQKNDREGFKFFVPFFENGEVGKIDYSKDILTNRYIEKYEYGLFIQRTKHLYANSTHSVLNSGIAVERTTLNDIFEGNFLVKGYGYHYRDFSYNDISVNFPANWLQLDVARETVTELSSIITDKESKRRPLILGEKVAESLYEQILQYIQYYENEKTKIPAIYLQDLIYCAIDFCGKQQSGETLREKLLKMRYLVLVEFSPKGLCYKIIRDGKRDERIRFRYTDTSSESKKEREKWLNKLKWRQRGTSIKRISDVLRIEESDTIHFLDEIMRLDRYDNDEIRIRCSHLLRNVPESLKRADDDKNIFKILTLLLLSMPDNSIYTSPQEVSGIVPILESLLLQHFRIGAETMQELSITYNELQKIISFQKGYRLISP